MKKFSHRHVRKTMAGVVALSMLCTAAVPTMLAIPAGAAASNASGDLNADGSVTAADVKTLQTALLGGTPLTAEQYLNADVVADGTVNGMDLAKLRQMAASTDPVSDAIYIHLNDAGITVEGDTKGVTAVSGKTVTISASGTYVVDGTITDGQILVNVPDTTADAGDVSLFLQDVTMTSSTGAPCVYGQSAAKIKLTCGGTNTLTDMATAANAATSGVIYGDCDITVTKNSTGSLNITSSMNTGINCKDDIKLNGGIINIVTDVDTASDADAIKANNTIEVDGATVTIDSSADGIKSSKENVSILSGTVSIKAGNDAVQAATSLAISGGTVVACGDRGFTLDEGGALAITGGNVIATATDYAFGQNATGTAMTIDTSGCTQTIMQLDYAAEWKKGNAVTIQKSGSTVYEMTPIKKFDYVLVSGSGLDASSTYQVYTGGTQMTHDGSANGEFKMTGSPTKFTGVTELSGGGTVTTSDDVATALVFSGSTITANNVAGEAISNPSNLTISGATVTVTASSEISVSGESDSGQIVVNVDKTAEPTGLVTLNLEGVTLSNSSVAPIYVEAIGDEVAISAQNGTTNTISDGTSHTDTYVDSDGVTQTVNGAIFSRDDLKIKGKGTLVVNGNTEDGIVCKNDLKLWNGNITVNAVDDGIRGNDSVRIGDPTDSTNYGTLSVTVNTNNGTTGGDGIKSTSTETDKGFVTISGGTVNINSYADGIQAEQTFTMNGGDVTINTYQGSGFTGSASSGNTGGWGGGMGGGMSDGNSNKTDISAKGIKAVGLYDAAGTTYQSGGNLTINGGTLKIDSSDDCVHCAGDLHATGGILTLASADDALHSDHNLYIGTENAGTYDDVQIYVSKCYEGVEGGYIYQNSGTVYIVSTDDGYNAAGGDGSGTSSSGGGFGQGGMSSDYGEVHLNGGLVVCNSASGDHDAFDSNGPLYINGGYYCANGQEPLDCGDGYSTTRTGGNVISMTGGNTSLTTRYTFVDASGNAIVSFYSASGGSLAYSENSTSAQSGGTISGGTDILTQSSYVVTVGGTISGGTALSTGSSGGNPGGPGNWG